MSKYVRAFVQEWFDFLETHITPPLPARLRIERGVHMSEWGSTSICGKGDKKYFEIRVNIDYRICDGCRQPFEDTPPAKRCAHYGIAQDTLIHEFAHAMSWNGAADPFGPEVEWGLWYSRIYHIIHGAH